MSEPEKASPLPPEFSLSRYQLGAQFSKGGMGGIWKATEATTGRTVAVKRMLQPDDPDGLRRFLTEARVTARLEHPNIVPVHELAADTEGHAFYSMKLVQGTDLASVLRRLAEGDAETFQKHTLAELLTVFQKVCDALAFAHSRNVIHRDLKPENIMLGPFGEVLVMDWGLAKILGQPEDTPAPKTTAVVAPAATEGSETGSQTLPGYALGTPYYMAPEQARGEVHHHDARTDIYALGAILYQILSLRVPVSGPHLRFLLARVAAGDLDPLITPSPLHRRRPPHDALAPGNPALPQPRLAHLPEGAIPQSLAAVVERAMALRPQDRYQSVPELQREITAYQQGYATTAEQAGLAKQILLALRRHRREAAVAAAALLVLIALTAVSFLRIRHERDLAEQLRRSAEEQRALAQTETARAERESQLAKEQSALAEQESRKAREQTALAEAQRQQAEQQRALVLQQTKLATEKGELADRFSKIAEDEKRRTLEQSKLLTRKDEETAVSDLLAASALIAKGARSEALVHLSRALQYPSQAGPAAKIVLEAFKSPGSDFKPLSGITHNKRITSAAYSPDGTRIVTASDDHSARVWDASNGSLIANLSDHTQPVTGVAFSPDGRKVATTAYRTLTLWQVDTATQLLKFPNVPSFIYRISFIREGNSLVLCSGTEHLVQRWELLRGAKPSRLFSDPEPTLCADISPDGQRLVTGSAEHLLRLRDPLTGSVLKTVSTQTRTVRGMQFSPDGQRIGVFYTDAPPEIFDALLDRRQSLQEAYPKFCLGLSFSPDGRRVALNGANNVVQIHDVPTGRLLGTTRPKVSGTSHATFSPDGKALLLCTYDGSAQTYDARLAPPSAQPPPLTAPNPPATPPDWLADLLIYLGGKRVNAQGQLEALSPDEKTRLRGQFASVARSPGDDDYLRLLRWSLLPPALRPPHPFGKNAQYTLAATLAQEKTDRANLERAYDLDPAHPLILALLAPFETNPQRAQFLRDYTLKNLPEDPALEIEAAALLRFHQQPAMVPTLTARAREHLAIEPFRTQLASTWAALTAQTKELDEWAAMAAKK